MMCQSSRSASAEEIRENVGEILQLVGYHVEMADSGQQALAKVEPAGQAFRRFTPSDDLLAFLSTL